MSFIYDLTDTWNNAGISFSGIKLNVTDTASAVGSKLIDLQVGGASKFSVSKTGVVTAAGIVESTVGGFKFPDGTIQTTRATGTVTSVSGTGTVSGLTLTGSVTSSGSLTLGGTLVLTSGQVTSALGFTPYNATNPSGYITASALTPYLTSASAATTYQPLDGDLTAIAALAGTAGIVRKTAANTYSLDTAAYITGITSGDVTTALGFTPYNATNPAGYTTNVGTVTGVNLTAGTGVSVSGGPITSSGSITVTNTAPDQVVSLAGAGTTTVTGTYPNFTITSTGGSGTVSSVAASGGTTGLTFTGSPITTSGTLTLGGTLDLDNGGTGATTAAGARTALGLGTAATTDASAYATAAQGAKADTAVQTIASADGSVTITGTTAIDLSVPVTAATNSVLLPVRNTTGATLTKGTAVYISGATGQLSTVSKAIATSDTTSAQTLGLVTANISNNANGNVTLIGTISNINTSAYTDGQQLYLSPTTAGTLTATKPYAPQHLVYVAVVEHAHPSQGKLFVKVQNGYEMDELHDVSAQSPANNDGLFYSTTTDLWEKKSIATALGYTPYNATNPAGYTNNTGTVTSVNLTAGTGVSVSGGPVTSSGSITVTNTAPDQVVSLTAGTNVTVTGTYPNFTIASTGGSGTVSSVAASGGTTGLTFTGSPITTSGTLTLGGTLATANGGTNLTSYTTGDLLYASAANTLSKLPIGTQNYSLVSNANVPTWSLVSLQNGVSGTLGVDKGGTGNNNYTVGALLAFGGTSSSQIVPDGASGYALKSNGAGSYPSYGPLSIVNATTGTLTVGRGGTGLTTCNPGDLLYASASNTMSNLPIGSATYVLTSNGAAPYWAAASGGGGGGGGVTSFSTGSTGLTPTSATTGAVTLGGTLNPASGGTGVTAYNYGDMLWANGGTNLTRLGIGSYGQFLTTNGSQPYWSNLSVNSSDISWNSTVQTYQGGTGTTSSPSNGQILIGSYGNYSTANITAGANITITNGPGSITIAAAGGGGGGPTINSLYLGTSMGGFGSSTPGAGYSKPLIGFTESGPSKYGAFFFSSSNTGYYSYLTINSLQVMDSGGGFSNYSSGPDFYGSFNINEYTVGCYGMNLYSSSIQTLFQDSSNALDANSFKPVIANSGPMSQNPSLYLSMSGGSSYSCSSGNAILVGYKSGSTYNVQFASNNTNYDTNFTTGYDITGLYFNINGSMQSYSMGSDYSISFWQNNNSGQFQFSLNPTNSNLITLLNNSSPGA